MKGTSAAIAAVFAHSAGAVSLSRRGPLRGSGVGNENSLALAAAAIDVELVSLVADRHQTGIDVPFEDFLPKCVKHLRRLVKTVDQSYTDAHLGDVLKFECEREPFGHFSDQKTCLDFASDLEKARDEELKTGAIDKYSDICKKYWEHSSGNKAPEVTTTSPPATSSKTPGGASSTTPPPARKQVNVGKSKCQCVGISGIKGATLVKLGGKDVEYPGDLGGSCTAWDKDVHPDCKGENPKDWCAQKWCYVDPCECDLDVLPKPSAYMPDAKFQGKPLYYSYATCDSKDTFAEGKQEADLAALAKVCKAPQDPFVVGFEQCRCIGIAGQSGTTVVNAGLTMPAEVGASCAAWDQNTHPDCKGDGDKPAWCAQKWCYVDPCSCNLPDESPPKLSAYLPGASYQNKPLYYSYATCLAGAKDHFTKENNPSACVNLESEEKCKAQSGKCTWHKSRCVGSEFAGMC